MRNICKSIYDKAYALGNKQFSPDENVPMWFFEKCIF